MLISRRRGGAERNAGGIALNPWTLEYSLCASVPARIEPPGHLGLSAKKNPARQSERGRVPSRRTGSFGVTKDPSRLIAIRAGNRAIPANYFAHRGIARARARIEQRITPTQGDKKKEVISIPPLGHYAAIAWWYRGDTHRPTSRRWHRRRKGLAPASSLALRAHVRGGLGAWHVPASVTPPAKASRRRPKGRSLVRSGGRSRSSRCAAIGRRAAGTCGRYRGT